MVQPDAMYCLESCTHIHSQTMCIVNETMSAHHVPVAIFHSRHNLLEEVPCFVLNKAPLFHNVVKQLSRLLDFRSSYPKTPSIYER